MIRRLLLLIFLLTPAASAASPDLTVIGRYYVPGSTKSGVPVLRQTTISEFGVRYVVAPVKPLQLLGEMEYSISRSKEGWTTIGGAYFHVGLRWQAHALLLLELKHGSWHNIDAAGPTEIYNRVGVEVRLP